MRRILLALAVLTAGAIAVAGTGAAATRACTIKRPCPTPTPTATPTATPTPTPAGFVQRSGNSLTLDGQPYKFTGLNAYSFGSNCAYTPNVDSELTSWGSGKEVVRTWMFQKNVTVGGVRDWTRFDNLIATAKAHGIKVIPVLTNGAPARDPGANADCDSHPTLTRSWFAGGYSTTIDLGTLTSYRQYVADIVSRYKDEPAIAFWQLGNELAVNGDGGTGCPADAAAVFKAFADDVGGMVHALDPNHLVSLGTLGNGQCGENFTDYQTVHSSAGIDLCEYHDYSAPTTTMPGDDFNGLQRRLTQCETNLGKPLFIGEAGIRADVGLQTRANDFEAKLTTQFAAGVVGYLPWHWYPLTDPQDFQIQAGDPALTVLGAH